MTTQNFKIENIKKCIQKCCEDYLNTDFFEVSLKLINDIQKNVDFSMDKGKLEGWAAAIIYIIGENSNIFEKNNLYRNLIYISKTDITRMIDVSMTTMKRRATEIRNGLQNSSIYKIDIMGEINYYEGYSFIEPLGPFSEDEIEILKQLLAQMEEEMNDEEYIEDEEISFDEIKEYYKDANQAMKQETKKILKNIQKSIKKHEKNISKKSLEEMEGMCWHDYKTREYIIDILHLGDAYRILGDLEKAAQMYLETLRLNKNDNQGARYLLTQILIALKEYDQADDIFKIYHEDECAMMFYNKAFYYYALKDELNAKKYLKKSFEENNKILEILTGIELVDILIQPDCYSSGSIEEAIIHVSNSISSWAKVDGFLDWMIDEYFLYAKKKKVLIDVTKKEGKKFANMLADVLGR